MSQQTDEEKRKRSEAEAALKKAAEEEDAVAKFVRTLMSGQKREQHRGPTSTIGIRG